MNAHFFINVPSLSWIEWIQRRIIPDISREPLCIPSKLPIEQSLLPHSPTGKSFSSVKASCAYEYRTFLATYFYPSSSPTQLLIPSSILESGIQQGHIFGAELRDKAERLIGIVFCLYAGVYKGTKMCLDTWGCVHPDWRKKGVSNYLLRSLYIVSQPHSIHWFRNDGWLKTILPPVWSEARMYRKKRSYTVFKGSNPSSHVIRSSFEKWGSLIKRHWQLKYPDGLVLEDASFKQSWIEVWEYPIDKTTWCVLLLQPTFECQRYTGTPNRFPDYWCEILGWTIHGNEKTDYEQAYSIEIMLDAIPYVWFDAPASMPHLECGWSYGSQTNWCVYGLDVGIPVVRPILPLCVA